MKIFTPAQMREFDRDAVKNFNIPSIVLMENAALRVVEFCEAKFGPLREKRVTVACGKGNNGGDGFAIARHLAAAGCEVSVVLAAPPKKLAGDTLVNFKGLPQLDILGANDDWPEADFVIDALLGTGFSGEVKRGAFAEILEWLQLHPAPIVAVDIPSGVDAESGEAAQIALRADYTVTFAAPKRGMFARDGVGRCGEIWVGDIGTHQPQMDATETRCEAATREFATHLAQLLQRAPDAHKGTAGRVMIVGGSRGMSGAVALASRAALAAGAGLCLAAVPDRILDTVAAGVLEATTTPLSCDEKGALSLAAFEEIAAKWQNAQVVAVGPGIGRSEETLKLVRRIVRECPQPLVVDADALYALRATADEVRKRLAPTILTPHPGEMAELLGISTEEIENDRYAAALQCAQQYDAIVVLKGARTLVCDGEKTWVNLSGNAGMATGGSGDVLTGTLAGLVAQSRDSGWTTVLGVYLHGLAGDIAAQTKGNGLVAGDIAHVLPLALTELQESFVPETINARLRRLQ
ncbi:MAG TPA: NAD(P)H-hydrate dehydratase [Abditibacteriaceae bacterium]|jgi:NAD(P)H-hydrate epimerase